MNEATSPRPTILGRRSAQFNLVRKQTEIGDLPCDWDVKALGELGHVVRGGSPRPAGDPRFFNGSFIPWLTVAALTNIPANQSDVTEALGYLTEEGAKRSRTLAPDTLIIANSGATLGVAKLLRFRCCANDGIAAIVEQRYGNKPFLCQYINTQTVRLRDVVATGNGQPNLNTKLIREILVPFPPSTEQQAIADALSDVDGLLGAMEKQIAKKRAIKQAAMQQLLTGKTRLPGFTGKWETKCLGGLGGFLKGKGIRRDDVSDEGVACIRYGELYTDYNDYITAPKSRVSLEVAATALPIENGDLLFAGSGETAEEIGKCAAYLGEEPAYAGGDIVVLRATGQNALYLGHLLNHPVVADQKSRYGQGDAVVHISSRNLAQVEIDLPPTDEQAAIATVLADMDAEIEELERRRGKTRRIKQGMMQQLLTGRIRLVTPQAPASPAIQDSKGGKAHSWAFNEAVVIATLAKSFGSEQFPLGRKRYTKLSYLLHRHAERQAEGYLKKSAGPYNPKTKYGGPERIAIENGYIREHKSGAYCGFVSADNIAQAEGYFEKWYGPDSVQWLTQFRFKKNDDLELLATVDMAAEELRAAGKTVDVEAVKAVIRSHPEWKAKLDRTVFSDANIAKAIETSRELFEAVGEPKP